MVVTNNQSAQYAYSQTHQVDRILKRDDFEEGFDSVVSERVPELTTIIQDRSLHVGK